MSGERQEEISYQSETQFWINLIENFNASTPPTTMSFCTITRRSSDVDFRKSCHLFSCALIFMFLEIWSMKEHPTTKELNELTFAEEFTAGNDFPCSLAMNFASNKRFHKHFSCNRKTSLFMYLIILQCGDIDNPARSRKVPVAYVVRGSPGMQKPSNVKTVMSGITAVV